MRRTLHVKIIQSIYKPRMNISIMDTMCSRNKKVVVSTLLNPKYKPRSRQEKHVENIKSNGRHEIQNNFPEKSEHTQNSKISVIDIPDTNSRSNSTMNVMLQKQNEQQQTLEALR